MAANRTNPAALKTTQNPQTQQPNAQLQGEFLHRSVWKAAVLGNLNAMAMVLAARLFVLIATGGAIFLAVLALRRPDSWNSLAVLGAYLLGGLVPLVWLASRK